MNKNSYCIFSNLLWIYRSSRSPKPDCFCARYQLSLYDKYVYYIALKIFRVNFILSRTNTLAVISISYTIFLNIFINYADIHIFSEIFTILDTYRNIYIYIYINYLCREISSFPWNYPLRKHSFRVTVGTLLGSTVRQFSWMTECTFLRWGICARVSLPNERYSRGGYSVPLECLREMKGEFRGGESLREKRNRK